ncbi:polysaccharide pyruvyl transferase family protein [Georgenia alba]|uniref:Polysaccharide pyruvyl transferase family protein n=1 Tax=Georgenia alba TaxID=2233858 RepID=A0ABW2QBS0_9MICO
MRRSLRKGGASPARLLAGARRRAGRARRNLRALRVLRRSLEGAAPPEGLRKLYGRGGRPRGDLVTGRRSWHACPGAADAAADLLREALVPGRGSAAAAIAVELVRARPRDAELHRLAALAAGLVEDWDLAEDRWARALELEGSSPERAAGLVADERRRSEQRRAVAGQRVPSRLEARRRELLGRSVWEDPDGAFWRYVAQAVACDALEGLEPVLDGLVPADRPLPNGKAPREITDAIAAADALEAEADYPGALRELDRIAPTEGKPTVRYLITLARLASAVSDYRRARVALRLAGAADEATSLAAAHDARIAWVVHDTAGARRSAELALSGGQDRPQARAVLDLLERQLPPPDPPAGGIAHVAFFAGRGFNFGDILLPLAVQDAIGEAVRKAGPAERPAGGPTWLPFHVHQLFDEDYVRLANTQRAVVVGGGGLFLPDTSPNGHSGWQWNVPRTSLEALRVPLFLFAVGYNLFPGQSFRGNLFRENLVALAEKAELLGLRNHGSIDRVREMLPDELTGKVRFVPCATTVLERLRDDLPPAETGTGRILLNAAFDRSARRFGHRYDDVLEQVHRFVLAARDMGADVRVSAHMSGDERIATDLRSTYDVDLPVENLHTMDVGDALATYRNASLVIGMRGHATMIPFGLGTPVLSIVSHPKMRYFLDDVGRAEWGVDVGDSNLGDRLTDLARDVLAREEDYRRDVRERQQGLFDHVAGAAELVAARTTGPPREEHT